MERPLKLYGFYRNCFFPKFIFQKILFHAKFQWVKKMITLQLPFQKVFKLLMTKYIFQVIPLHLGVQFRSEFYPYLKELIDCIFNTYILQMVKSCFLCYSKVAIYRGNSMELQWWDLWQLSFQCDACLRQCSVVEKKSMEEDLQRQWTSKMNLEEAWVGGEKASGCSGCLREFTAN